MRVSAVALMAAVVVVVGPGTAAAQVAESKFILSLNLGFQSGSDDYADEGPLPLYDETGLLGVSGETSTGMSSTSARPTASAAVSPSVSATSAAAATTIPRSADSRPARSSSIARGRSPSPSRNSSARNKPSTTASAIWCRSARSWTCTSTPAPRSSCSPSRWSRRVTVAETPRLQRDAQRRRAERHLVGRPRRAPISPIWSWMAPPPPASRCLPALCRFGVRVPCRRRGRRHDARRLPVRRRTPRPLLGPAVTGHRAGRSGRPDACTALAPQGSAERGGG